MLDWPNLGADPANQPILQPPWNFKFVKKIWHYAILKVAGHFNPRVLNPKVQTWPFQPQAYHPWIFHPWTFQPWTFSTLKTPAEAKLLYGTKKVRAWVSMVSYPKKILKIYISRKNCGSHLVFASEIVQPTWPISIQIVLNWFSRQISNDSHIFVFLEYIFFKILYMYMKPLRSMSHSPLLKCPYSSVQLLTDFSTPINTLEAWKVHDW